MLANNNLKICRILVERDFRFHRVKNLVLALAAALVTALYSFVFLLGSSVESAFLLSYQYAYGSASHIVYTGLTKRQADALVQNDRVKRFVRTGTIGRLSDPMLGRRLVKLAVADWAYAETVQSVPTVGRLPNQYGEIALDEFTMDSLGVAHETGTPVEIRWTDAGGGEHVSAFTLCGFWSSPMNYTEACAWVSGDTAQALEPDYAGDVAQNVMLGVDLYRPVQLEEQAEAILREQKIAGGGYTVNLAYNDARREMAGRQAMPYYVPAAAVLLCGFLMVYCIVHVLSGRDMLFWADLKSLGMTPRQIRWMLFGQAGAVAFLGLVPGWFLGFLLHVGITGRVISGMEENPALYFLSWEPFAGAALCMLFTVFAAYLVPTARLSGMSPAQTMRFVSGRAQVHGRGSDGRITLAQLALRTLGRGRWRTLLSVASMLVAVLLLSSVWIRYVSVKQDLYLSVMSPWDYSISDGSAYLSVQRYNEQNRGIVEEDVEKLRSRPEVVLVSTLKSREVQLRASKQLRERICAYYDQPYEGEQTLRDSQKGYPDWCEGLDRLERNGTYVGLVIGLDGAYLDFVLENCPFTSGSFDANAFASGEYVLAAGAYHEGVSTPAAGETVKLGGQSFLVMGSVMHDDSYLQGCNSQEAAFHIAYILPQGRFEELFAGQGYRQLAVHIDHGRQEDFEAYLDTYEQDVHHGVGITRRSDYQKNFETARLNLVLPELVIGLVLGVVALINFANMLIVKTVGRKSEFALYEGLGMTRPQLCLLLVLEGGFHGLLMLVVIVPVTFLFDRYAMPKMVEAMKSWSMAYTFSALPLWIFIAVIVLFAIAVPLLSLGIIAKGSIHSRMREAK